MCKGIDRTIQGNYGTTVDNGKQTERTSPMMWPVCDDDCGKSTYIRFTTRMLAALSPDKSNRSLADTSRCSRLSAFFVIYTLTTNIPCYSLNIN